MLEAESDISLGARIRQVRRSQGLTQKAFADSLGIAQGYLSSLEAGKKIPSETLLIALTHLYHVDERWLLSGEGAPEAEILISAPAGEVRLSESRTPLLKRIPPEFPRGISAEDVLEYLSIPDTPSGCYAMVAYGDFMAPTIQDKDLVFFKPGEEARTGDVVLVSSKWDDTILRRYRINADGIWLSPDNSLYKPFQPASNCAIIGKVMAVWRKVKF